MATYASTITAVRRLLKEYPARVDLAAAISDTSTATFTVAAADIGQFKVGQRWEHDDGDETGAEQRYVTAVNASTNVVTADRGAFGSTAATHVDASYVIKAPRFPYDEVKQVIDSILDGVLFGKGLYEIVEHEITSSTTTNHYNAPTTSCMEFLHVYMKPAGYTEPYAIRDFSRTPINVDTDLYANNLVFYIGSPAIGSAGTDVFYVNCKHKLAIGTLNTAQERIVQYLTVAYLLEAEDVRRTGQDNRQGDRSITPGVQARLAQVYEERANKMLRAELSNLRTLNPPYRVFKRN